MAKQQINLGTAPTGQGGDTPRSANVKIGANFDELYAALGASGSPAALPGALPVEKGGTGGATPASARSSLGLGSAATANIGEGAGNVLVVGAGGLLGTSISLPSTQYLVDVQKCGFSSTNSNPDTPSGAPYSTLLTIKYPQGYYTSQLATNILTGQMFSRVVSSSGAPGPWRKIYDDSNTTRAADGTLKAI